MYNLISVMFLKLLSLFVIIPFIELAILIKVGTIIGFWYTMLIVIFTGVAGALLARYQGLKVYGRIQRELNSGRIPSNDMIDGLLILSGAIVLLTPGFITDITGLLCLFPLTRNIIKIYLKKIFAKRIEYYNKKTTVTIDD